MDMVKLVFTVNSIAFLPSAIHKKAVTPIWVSRLFVKVRQFISLLFSQSLTY